MPFWRAKEKKRGVEEPLVNQNKYHTVLCREVPGTYTTGICGLYKVTVKCLLLAPVQGHSSFKKNARNIN